MRPPSMSQSGGMSINMTPMIDVVFQLIVFFTATSTFVNSEFGKKVDLPNAEKGRDRDLSSLKKKITVNIVDRQKADPNASRNSRPGFDVFVGASPITPARFQAILKAELAERSAEELEVQFRADRSAPYRIVEPLLLACAKAGVWQVSFAVKPAERVQGSGFGVE